MTGAEQKLEQRDTQFSSALIDQAQSALHYNSHTLLPYTHNLRVRFSLPRIEPHLNPAKSLKILVCVERLMKEEQSNTMKHCTCQMSKLNIYKCRKWSRININTHAPSHWWSHACGELQLNCADSFSTKQPWGTPYLFPFCVISHKNKWLQIVSKYFINFLVPVPQNLLGSDSDCNKVTDADTWIKRQPATSMDRGAAQRQRQWDRDVWKQLQDRKHWS